jgi:thiol-disulfide isomerase/thioredoxin
MRLSQSIALAAVLLATPFASAEDIAASLDGLLYKVDAEGLVETQLEGEPEFFIAYHSASWCGPCKTFSKELLALSKAASEHKNFALVLVNYDVDEKAMGKYMVDAAMPWYALKHDARESNPLATAAASDFIPHLVIVDREGKVLAKDRAESVAMLEGWIE